VIEAETCCHLVTLNKINIHNTSCVLTCESLLPICIHRTQRGWITWRLTEFGCQYRSFSCLPAGDTVRYRKCCWQTQPTLWNRFV